MALENDINGVNKSNQTSPHESELASKIKEQEAA
jgi:hypothetical protein